MTGSARGVFAYDFKMATCGSDVRIRHFPYELFETRYLSVFSSLAVLGRSYPQAKDESLAFPISSGPRLHFSSLPNLNSVSGQLKGRRHALAILREQIGAADLVIARLPSEIGNLAAKVADELGIPWTAEVVGCPFDALWNHGSIRGKLWAPVSAWRLRRRMGRCKAAVYVTSKFLQKRYPATGDSIPCSNVALERVCSPADLSDRFSKIRQHENIVVGLIGFLAAGYKGIDTAIRSLATLLRHDVRLEVVGGGDSQDLQRLARNLGVQDRVIFRGQMPHDLVLDWLDTVDIYIQPSRQEGLPRALLEAMSRGCPAIGSTSGGIPELLPPELLHRPGDHAHLAELLTKAIADEDWRKSASLASITTARMYTRAELDRRRKSFLMSILAKA